MANTFTYDDFVKDFAKEAALPKEAVKVVRQTVKLEGPRQVQRQIEALHPPPVDRGTYRAGFRFEDIPGGAIAYNHTKQGAVIEDGRRAGGRMPPIDVIAEWVKRKGIGLQYQPVAPRRGGGRLALAARRRARRLTDAAARSIAFMIARSIKARGLPPKLVLDKASHHIDEKVREAIDRLLDGRRRVVSGARRDTE